MFSQSILTKILVLRVKLRTFTIFFPFFTFYPTMEEKGAVLRAGSYHQHETFQVKNLA